VCPFSANLSNKALPTTKCDRLKAGQIARMFAASKKENIEEIKNITFSFISIKIKAKNASN
jgi:hypothetical protein